MDAIQQAVHALGAIPAVLLYAVLAVGAALENLVPPIPADVFVVAGGILAAHGIAMAWLVFLVTWLPNAASAVAVYFAAWRYGGRFFRMPVARWLLQQHQLEQVGRFYARWGVLAILVGRLLPGWRAMVPVFAGVTRMPGRRAIPPLVLASALWHALLVYLGVLAGRNLDSIVALLSALSQFLVWIGLALLLALAAWWWRTRHPRESQ